MSKRIDVKDEPDATLPANDVERWIAGTYAIWSEYCGGSCKYLGGYEKTAENAKMVAKVLYRDWLVKDHKSGVEMIEYLLKHAGPDNDDVDFGDGEYGEDNEDFEDDEEDDEDFEDDEEDDEDFEDDDENDEDFQDDEEDDEDFEEDDEDDEDFEEDDEDDEDFEDDEEDGEDFEDDDDEDDEDFEDDEYEVSMNFGDQVDKTAFDYACACNMCGRMFIAGYFTREESIFYAAKVARKIQEKYNSWVEYFQAYIFGAAAGSNVRQAAPFIEAFQKIMGMGMQENPIYMDWNIDLNG